MQAGIRENATTHGAWCVIHPLNPEDSAAMTALRSAVAGMKGKLEGTAARGPFNGIMERVAAPGGVTFEADTVGGISGWWVCHQILLNLRKGSMRSVLTTSIEHNFNEDCPEALSNRGIQSQPTSSPVVEMLGAQSRI